MRLLLRRVVIENFRGLKNLSLELDETTVLIGENNCGKSSVLDAIKLCLSRNVRGNPFEDQDHHLGSSTAAPGDAGAIKITLHFRESTIGEWPAEVIQALPDAAVFDASGLYNVIFLVTSSYDHAIKDFVTSWDFLDPTGKALLKAKRSSTLSSLQGLFNVFYLTAFRDASKDFSPKSAFWGPFLRNPLISDSVKDDLEKELAALNTKILNAEQRLKQVGANLGKAQKVVSLGKADTVSIDAIPSRIWDMLSRAQVNVAAITGASLPLLKHGAGTQSLASIFLFQAFLAAGIGKVDPFASSLLQIEEPEAHLHPSAVRSLWPTLSASSEQKIIATHSGDLLSEVPLRSLRRLVRTAQGVEVKSLDASAFDPSELDKVTFHIRQYRGELFFARVWLLHEGQTEYWVLNEAARALGASLDQQGIRLVEYANFGLATLIKLADQFGIAWHVVSDSDPAGTDYNAVATAALNGRPAGTHISMLPQTDMEQFLCANGFGQIYASNVSNQKVQLINVPPGTPQYWAQVISAQSKQYKIPCALKVASAIQSGGAAVVPTLIKDILDKAVLLGA